MERYSRQSILSQIGIDGQKKIAAARVAIIGLGALGSVSAQLCARAGIGYLRVIDRDVIEWSNLQRQVLFTEKDAKAGLAKATAAKNSLEAINSDIQIEAIIEDVHAGNFTLPRLALVQVRLRQGAYLRRGGRAAGEPDPRASSGRDRRCVVKTYHGRHAGPSPSQEGGRHGRALHHL